MNMNIPMITAITIMTIIAAPKTHKNIISCMQFISFLL